MGRITTHVLDLAAGRPAAGLTIELHRVGAGRLAAGATNGDGRIERPLLEGEALTAGTYELQFHVGDYWRSGGAANAEAGFLDIVPIRFGVASPDQHYHVPLLLSPFGYSTYRGS